MRTIHKLAIALLVAGFATGAWLLEGRYLVEGGRAPWAVINGRDDVLAEALASGISDGEKETALRHATSRGKIEALKMLLAAGVKSGEEQEGLYPRYSDELQAFLAPHVGGPK